MAEISVLPFAGDLDLNQEAAVRRAALRQQMSAVAQSLIENAQRPEYGKGGLIPQVAGAGLDLVTGLLGEIPGIGDAIKFLKLDNLGTKLLGRVNNQSIGQLGEFLSNMQEYDLRRDLAFEEIDARARLQSEDHKFQSSILAKQLDAARELEEQRNKFAAEQSKAEREHKERMLSEQYLHDERMQVKSAEAATALAKLNNGAEFEALTAKQKHALKMLHAQGRIEGVFKLAEFDQATQDRTLRAILASNELENRKEEGEANRKSAEAIAKDRNKTEIEVAQIGAEAAIGAAGAKAAVESEKANRPLELASQAVVPDVVGTLQQSLHDSFPEGADAVIAVAKMLEDSNGAVDNKIMERVNQYATEHLNANVSAFANIEEGLNDAREIREMIDDKLVSRPIFSGHTDSAISAGRSALDQYKTDLTGTGVYDKDQFMNGQGAATMSPEAYARAARLLDSAISNPGIYEPFARNIAAKQTAHMLMAVYGQYANENLPEPQAGRLNAYLQHEVSSIDHKDTEGVNKTIDRMMQNIGGFDPEGKLFNAFKRDTSLSDALSRFKAGAMTAEELYGTAVSSGLTNVQDRSIARIRTPAQTMMTGKQSEFNKYKLQRAITDSIHPKANVLLESLQGHYANQK